jgi:hypothetical protein
LAPDATSTASPSRRRSPPESERTSFSWASQPEKRKRPRAVELRHPHDAVECRAALVELGAVLREVPELDAVPELVPARGNGFEEGRLAAPVRADQAYMLAALEYERHVPEEDAVRDTDLGIVDLEH